MHQRMREAVNAQVRRENEKELSLANDFWKKIAIEKNIYREVKARMRPWSTSIVNTDCGRPST